MTARSSWHLAAITLACALQPGRLEAQEPLKDQSAAAIAPQTPAEHESQPVLAGPPQRQSTGEIIGPGTGEFLAKPKIESTPKDDGLATRDILFDKAPVGLVVQTLLAEISGASVLIDPRVQGELTIRSVGQIKKSEIAAFLKTAVASIGLELIEQAPRVFLLRPAGGTDRGAAQVFRSGQDIGTGVTIYDLRFVSAENMRKTIQLLVPEGVTIQVEPNRELLFITGRPDQVRSILGTIELFDVDWLAGVSLGLVPLAYSDPDAIVEQLRILFGGTSGSIGTLIEFVPLKSRRAIIVLAKRPERLDQARAWIGQLDQPDQFAGLYRVLQIKHVDAEKILQTITPILGVSKDSDVRISVDPGRNALIVFAPSGTSAEIENLVSQLDVPADQVVIEAVIVEVGLNKDLEFGVQWSLDTRDGGLITLSEAATGAVLPRFPGFSYGFNSGAVQAQLNALASRTNIEVVSNPVLVTQDNEEAELQVGDQVPLVVQSAANITNPEATVVNTVEYRDTGIVLKVRPRIGETGSVTLEILQEVSDVVATTTSGIDSPTIQQRRFRSIVTVQDQATVALGGLIRATRTRSRSGIPPFSGIPILGSLFGNTRNDSRRTELLVFLTPRIVRNGQDADAASQDLVARMQRLQQSDFIRDVTGAK